MHHYITQYLADNGKKYAVAWFQINFLKYSFCFSKRKIELHN